MGSLLSLHIQDVQNSSTIETLSNALVLALHVHLGHEIPQTGVVASAFKMIPPISECDLPITVKINGQEFVVDEDEVSAVYKDALDTTCAFYVRSDRTCWSQWSDRDGQDSTTRNFIYTGNREKDQNALREFVLAVEG